MNKKEPQSSNFLIKKHEDVTKNHNEVLGFYLPDDYFVQSKSEILDMVSQKIAIFACTGLKIIQVCRFKGFAHCRNILPALAMFLLRQSRNGDRASQLLSG